jgi:hypothetical protein
LPKEHAEHKKYESRLIGRPDEYFEKIYNKFYAPVLNKKYDGNYGIYCTPLNLFFFENMFDFRFVIDIDFSVCDVVAQVDGMVRKIYSIRELGFIYYSRRTIKRLWDGSDLHFKHLPQVVIFTDRIEIKKKDLQKRNSLCRRVAESLRRDYLRGPK